MCIQFCLSSMNACFRAMEGIIRSFNNLLETLHHSLYFYLLPSSWSFVSIAFYTPPFGLFLLPLALEISKPTF